MKKLLLGLIIFMAQVVSAYAVPMTYEADMRVDSRSEIGSDLFNANAAVTLINKYGNDIYVEEDSIILLHIQYPITIPDPGDGMVQSLQFKVKKNLLTTNSTYLATMSLSNSIGKSIVGLAVSVCTSMANSGEGANNCIYITEGLLDVDIDNDGHTGRPTASGVGGSETGDGTGGDAGLPRASVTHTFWACRGTPTGVTCSKKTVTIMF